MKKLLSLGLCSLAFLSCIQTPGLKEPNIVECTVLVEYVECVDHFKGETYQIPFEDLLGFIAVSPKDYAKIKNHHDALHTELNFCKDKKK